MNHHSIPWYAYLALLMMYLIFEALYKRANGSFIISDLIREFNNGVKDLADELRSDKNGARLCARALSTYLMIAPVLIVVGIGILHIIRPDSGAEIEFYIVLLFFLIVSAFVLKLINVLFMSLYKKLQ
jgi:hypothetical protein